MVRYQQLKLVIQFKSSCMGSSYWRHMNPLHFNEYLMRKYSVDKRQLGSLLPGSVHRVFVVEKRTGDVSRWRDVLLFQRDRSAEKEHLQRQANEDIGKVYFPNEGII